MKVGTGFSRMRTGRPRATGRGGRKHYAAAAVPVGSGGVRPSEYCCWNDGAVMPTAVHGVGPGGGAGAATSAAFCIATVSLMPKVVMLFAGSGYKPVDVLHVVVVSGDHHFDVPPVGTPWRFQFPQPPPSEGGLAGVVHLPTGPTGGAVVVPSPVRRISIGDQMRLNSG